MAGFPKVVYHPEHGERLLHGQAEVAALGSGWHESPAFNEPVVVAPEVVADAPDPVAEDAVEAPVVDAPKKPKGRK